MIARGRQAHEIWHRLFPVSMAVLECNLHITERSAGTGTTVVIWMNYAGRNLEQPLLLFCIVKQFPTSQVATWDRFPLLFSTWALNDCFLRIEKI